MTWIPKPGAKHNCYNLLPKSDLYKRATHNWRCECGKIYQWVRAYDEREGETSYWEQIA